jgi:hypothetical protein
MTVSRGTRRTSIPFICRTRKYEKVGKWWQKKKISKKRGMQSKEKLRGALISKMKAHHQM